MRPHARITKCAHNTFEIRDGLAYCHGCGKRMPEHDGAI